MKFKTTNQVIMAPPIERRLVIPTVFLMYLRPFIRVITYKLIYNWYGPTFFRFFIFFTVGSFFVCKKRETFPETTSNSPRELAPKGKASSSNIFLI